MLQEGETCVHYACDLTSDLAHTDDEEVGIMEQLLEFEPDFSVTTKYVSFHSILQEHSRTSFVLISRASLLDE